LRQTRPIAIEHVVVASNRPYEQVKASLESQLGVLGNIDETVKQLAAANPSWEQVTQAIDERMGTSGFSIFSKREAGNLLALAGKPRRVIQYSVGNPLLAIQMIERVPEVALYAPLRLAVYEGEQGKTFIAYDRFSSLLAQYQQPEVTRVAQHVEEKLEELVAQAAGGER
jgi:uncharacterized protein (DUF302 family)